MRNRQNKKIRKTGIQDYGKFYRLSEIYDHVLYLNGK